MDENNKEKNEYVTAKVLDERLGEQTQVIISAVESMLNKQKDELKADINNVRDELYIVRDELKAEINSVQSLIDGYVKAQEDFKQEFVIMKEEVRQMKQIFKDKLGVEIRAI
jgi:hypothetical protein